MKANELRIGNYVNVPTKEQCPFRIDAFEYCSEQFIKVAQEIEISGTQIHPLTWYGGDLEPIPLTEEWLLKFGFERLGSGRFDFKTFTYYLHDGSFYNKTSRLCTIKYVHQLQNLYFALTGEELTIKN